VSSILNRWKKQQPGTQLLPKLERWFDSSQGQTMLACQQKILDDVLLSQFGYHLLQLSIDSRVELFKVSRVQNKYRCHPFAGSADAFCDFQQLPFATESLDVVVLHHTQEFVSNPHQLLREVQRVMIPHGQLVIIGFNPWSPLGLYSHIGHFMPASVWQNQLISSRRMADWLSLLGFEKDSCQFGHHFPQALEHSRKPLVEQFLKHWPLGNFYLISAIKEEAGITPLRPRWISPRPAFAGLTSIKPSGRAAKIHTLDPPVYKEDVVA
jgi:SAM-dependent methyltransferase